MSVIIKILLAGFTLLGVFALSIYAYFEHKQLPVYDIRLALKVLLGKTSYKPYEGLE
jgi:hypothetical protein